MKNINNIHIQKAHIEDHLALSNVTKKSKAYWGYSPQQMQLWDDELTVTPNDFDRMYFYKLMQGKHIIGYYAYDDQSASSVKLESLFILPDFIGLGLGKLLLSDLIDRLQSNGCHKIVLEADPHAENFYLKHGFSVVGHKETSIKNRYMPIMEKIITS